MSHKKLWNCRGGVAWHIPVNACKVGQGEKIPQDFKKTTMESVLTGSVGFWLKARVVEQLRLQGEISAIGLMFSFPQTWFGPRKATDGVDCSNMSHKFC